MFLIFSFFVIFSQSVEISLKWDGTKQNQPKLEDLAQNLPPKEVFEIIDKKIEKYEDFKRISDLFGCRQGQTIIDFKNSLLIGSNVNFTLFNYFYLSRGTIKNAIFVNFSVPIAERIITDILFYNCTIEHCSFQSVSYVFAMKNNIVTFINLSIKNCNFYQTSLFGFDSSTIHFSSLSIINSNFKESNFLYSVGQICDCSKFLLLNCSLYKSSIFETFGASDYLYNLELTDSQVLNTNFYSSTICISDYFTINSFTNISIQNSKNIQLFSGRTKEISVETMIYSNNICDEIVINVKNAYKIIFSNITIQYNNFQNNFFNINTIQQISIQEMSLLDNNFNNTDVFASNNLEYLQFDENNTELINKFNDKQIQNDSFFYIKKSHETHLENLFTKNNSAKYLFKLIEANTFAKNCSFISSVSAFSNYDSSILTLTDSFFEQFSSSAIFSDTVLLYMLKKVAILTMLMH